MRQQVMSEHYEQVTLMQWAEMMRAGIPELWYLFAVPNGGARDARTGRNLKLEGVRKGVPDMMLAVPHGGFHGLFIELKKTKGGVVSPQQKEWIEMLNAIGYKAVVCKGWEEAADLILRYLGVEKR